jgi:hypothetical protein
MRTSPVRVASKATTSRASKLRNNSRHRAWDTEKPGLRPGFYLCDRSRKMHFAATRCFSRDAPQMTTLKRAIKQSFLSPEHIPRRTLGDCKSRPQPAVIPAQLQSF